MSVNSTFMAPREFSQLIGCTLNTEMAMRKRGEVPRHLVIPAGRTVRIKYFRDDVKRWLAARERQ